MSTFPLDSLAQTKVIPIARLAEILIYDAMLNHPVRPSERSAQISLQSFAGRRHMKGETQ
jgi:hypothetical protein